MLSNMLYGNQIGIKRTARKRCNVINAVINGFYNPGGVGSAWRAGMSRKRMPRPIISNLAASSVGTTIRETDLYEVMRSRHCSNPAPEPGCRAASDAVRPRAMRAKW